jgi:two-component system, chemotaxis family, CheB/CheR fusion protein
VVDLVNVMRSAIEITRVSASLKGVRVESEVALPSAPVVGDSVRLLQVVWNLLTNAIKFTPQGGAVDIRLDREGNEARISVQDTGEGITSQFLPHVFELFRQAEAADDHSTGLGIGLAIASQIVKLHGGTVRAESPGVGEGSTFIVTLPLALPEANQITTGSTVKSGRRSRIPASVPE